MKVWLRIGVLAIGVLIGTGLAWGGMAIAAGGSPRLWGLAGLAYTLGLRHGLDADHITAIDNVTRKLVSDGTNAVTVGMYFSVGHCVVVICACAIVFATQQALDDQRAKFMDVLDIVSAVLASAFLLIIGLMNLLSLLALVKELIVVQRDKMYVERSWDETSSHGLIAYCARPLFKLVRKPWKMLFLGVIFGFGFDTVASVTVIAASANTKMEATVFQGIMLSVVFSAGMILIDSADGVLMSLTYTWAEISPVRKVYFSLLITLIAVVAAFFVGIIILFQLIIDRTSCTEAAFCRGVTAISDNFEYVGVGLVGMFVSVWVFGYLAYNKTSLHLLEKEIRVVDSRGRLLIDEAGLRIKYDDTDEEVGSSETQHAITSVSSQMQSTCSTSGCPSLTDHLTLFAGSMPPIAFSHLEVQSIDVQMTADDAPKDLQLGSVKGGERDPDPEAISRGSWRDRIRGASRSQAGVGTVALSLKNEHPLVKSALSVDTCRVEG